MSIAPKNWCVFISGQGSNLRAFLQAPEYASVKLVVSSKSTAPGILFAKRRGIPVHVLPKTIDWQELNQVLVDRRIERIFLLGFMKILPQEFVDLWRHKMINLHPSLLPQYPGLRSIERAYFERADIGVTIHEVVPEMDAGPRIWQKKVLVTSDLSGLSLDQCEFKTHIVEQQMVRGVLKRWK